ncbi:MAG: alpha/beta hydrolase, partial [Actinomycetota bacterium]|nr:alpha/beta hydrolase [Actinomycetota bacterium]
SCIEPEAAMSENIAVLSSHCGIGHHPAAMYAIADRLSQPVGEWAPFQPPKLLRHLYPA